MFRSLLIMGVVVCALAAQTASAQWAWKDAKGTTVFSDQPPPPDVKPSQIIRQPGAGSVAMPSDPAPAAPQAAKPAKSAAQMDAEFRKRQADKAETESKASAAAERDRQVAEQCARMRSSYQLLQEGQRFRSPTTGGVMDDSERAHEIDRLNKAIADTCK